jgi:spoIIIJ-associated protein
MEKRGESVEGKGRSVDEAIDNALAELGAKRDDVEVEILSRGSRGVFGIGAEDARVVIRRLEKGAPSAPAPKAKPAPRPAKAAQPAPVAPQPVDLEEEEVEEEDFGVFVEPEDEEWVAEAPAEGHDYSHEEVEQVAAEALAGLLKRMSIDAEVVPKQASGFMAEGNSSPPIVVDIVGEDLGVLIGRRGETLAALQYLVRLMVNHRTRRWYNIVVDVEGYKGRRERQLRQLAERMAERVVATQRPVTLEAMPAYERRIIHLTLRNHSDVTTQSVGEDEDRKVMIILR